MSSKSSPEKCAVSILDIPTSTPGPNEVLIKVEYASLIAFDTYQVDLGYHVQAYPTILGFNAAGVVVEVGSMAKSGLKAGDRVTAFTYQKPERKGLQEYVVQDRSVVAKVPHAIPLSEAVTIPDNFITAFGTLFNPIYLGDRLPRPNEWPASTPPPLADAPILVYGGGSTAGQYTIQLLHVAGYHNIITTASSKHHDYLRKLGAKHTLDYNSPSIVDDINNAAGGKGKISIAIDAITAEETLKLIARVISKDAKVAILLPIKEGKDVRAPEGKQMHMDLSKSLLKRLNIAMEECVEVVGVRTFLFHEDEWQKENIMPKVLPELLEKGLIEPNKIRLFDEKQGSLLERTELALDLLRNNKVSGEKIVIKIGQSDL